MLTTICVTAPEDFVVPFATRGPMVVNAGIKDSMERPSLSINLRFPSFHQVNVEYPYATSKAKGLQASNDNVKVRVYGVYFTKYDWWWCIVFYKCTIATDFQFRRSNSNSVPIPIPIPISTQLNHTF